jgi:hypothetical protein
MGIILILLIVGALLSVGVKVARVRRGGGFLRWDGKGGPSS